MQKILTCPKSEVADFYYKSKINLYNFTIFDMAPRLGTCYIWNETEGKKGSSEVASGVYNFIDKKQKEGTVEFVFYSDNPTSQNKNRYVFSMYLLASTKYRVKITHRYLEVGHTQMEVDSMHAAIEKSVKKKEIFSIEEWYSYILDAKKNGKHRNDPAVKYTIEKVGETYENLDFKPLAHFDPAKPGIVSIKYNYNSNPIEVNVKDKRGRPVNLTTYTPGSAYNAKFPLAENKIKDLKDLIRSVE
ncbi:N-acetyl-gamma-glutamyl-phosphate reductase, partial [Frankliniella fusca]